MIEETLQSPRSAARERERERERERDDEEHITELE